MLPDQQKHARALLRLLLGMVQMFGAALALILLLDGRVRFGMAVVAATCLVTAVSVLLFGTRSSNG